MVGRILAHGGHNRAVGQCQRTVGRGEGEFREEVAQGELQKQKSLRIRQAGIVIRYAPNTWHLGDKLYGFLCELCGRDTVMCAASD